MNDQSFLCFFLEAVGENDIFPTAVVLRATDKNHAIDMIKTDYPKLLQVISLRKPSKTEQIRINEGLPFQPTPLDSVQMRLFEMHYRGAQS